jgi:hypothetical protein
LFAAAEFSQNFLAQVEGHTAEHRRKNERIYIIGEITDVFRLTGHDIAAHFVLFFWLPVICADDLEPEKVKIISLTPRHSV